MHRDQRRSSCCRGYSLPGPPGQTERTGRCLSQESGPGVPEGIYSKRFSYAEVILCTVLALRDVKRQGHAMFLRHDESCTHARRGQVITAEAAEIGCYLAEPGKAGEDPFIVHGPAVLALQRVH